MSDQSGGSGPDVNIDTSHVSEHGTSGTEGTHEISQNISTDRGTDTESSAISYTDVTPDGDVGDSGFDSPASEK